MSYEPTEWKKGDVVTSQKLNKLEQGVAGAVGVLVAHQNDETGALDKTWKEIYDALVAGMYVIVMHPYDDGITCSIIFNAEHAGEAYSISSAEGANFLTDSENGYPVFNPVLNNF